MQVEIISALIGAAVAVPAAGVAYAVGRRQAEATVSAAETQVMASHKQWRDEARRSAWLAFVRSADELAGAADSMARGERSYDDEFHSALSELHEKRASVEFEGPASIYRIARRMDEVLTERLLLSAMIHPFMRAQRKFDRELAEAQRNIAEAAPGAAPPRALLVVEAKDALEELCRERFSTQVEPLPDSVMETAMMLFAPFIQGAGAGNREAMGMIAQGIVRMLLPSVSAMPTLVVNAQRKLQDCGAFDERDIGGLITLYVSGMATTAEGSLRWFRNSFREVRVAFLKETDKHLESRLPVPR